MGRPRRRPSPAPAPTGSEGRLAAKCAKGPVGVMGNAGSMQGSSSTTSRSCRPTISARSLSSSPRMESRRPLGCEHPAAAPWPHPNRCRPQGAQGQAFSEGKGRRPKQSEWIAHGKDRARLITSAVVQPRSQPGSREDSWPPRALHVAHEQAWQNFGGLFLETSGRLGAPLRTSVPPSGTGARAGSHAVLY